MNELEELMSRVHENPALRDEFCAKFLAAQVFVINAGEASEAEGETVLEQDTAIQLLNGQFENGDVYIPVFTSREELARFIEEEMPIYGFDGASLLRILGGSNILINPASEHAVYWPADAVQNIVGHFLGHSQTVQEETQVLLGHPAEDPVEMKQAIAEIFANDKNVRAAYLALMMKGEERSFVVGVVLDNPAVVQSVFDKAGAVGGQKLPSGHYLDFILISDADKEDGLAHYLLHEGDQFYMALGNN